jgi:hypothetical protein
MPTRKRFRCTLCGYTMAAWIPVAECLDSARLLHHLGQDHPGQAGAYLDRMQGYVRLWQVSGGLLVALFLMPPMVLAQAMRWPEAVAALARGIAPSRVVQEILICRP